ncbi:MAG: glycosyltransferase [Chloroflexi bacterium B3_Chlor]|nr:MAG: glycosyltransferase [Chloroflexi bacterium B3_Chlor]
MRVAMVAPPWFKIPPEGYGGIEVIIHLLVEGLIDKGHEVSLCTISASSSRASIHRIFDDEMKSYLDAPPSSFLNIALTHSLACYKEIPREGADIIHDHTWKEGLLAAAFIDIPVVHTVHGPFDEENERFYRLFKGSERMHFVTISDFHQACLPGLNYAGTVYNGILFDKYPFSEDKEDFFFYIGRFNEEKAPHLACEVAKELGARLILAGKVHEEEERSYFDRRIIPYLSSDIQFIGELGHWSKEKMHLFSRAKGYLYPIQWEEPFGITMVEAMACGTPVVTFKRGAAPEIVAHEVTGFVVETMDEFIEAVKQVGEIDAQKCRERAESMFTARTMVDGYERVYKRVLGIE